MINIALAFSFLLQKFSDGLVATHAIAREMIANASQELDAFMTANGAYAPNIDTCLASSIASLPPAVQETVLLDVSVSHFTA